jgi:hypothetical protein
VDYSVQNEEIDQALRNLSIDLRELEKERFNIKIWDEINVAPMRSYIEEWIQREIDKLTDKGQQAVGTIPVCNVPTLGHHYITECYDDQSS